MQSEKKILNFGDMLWGLIKPKVKNFVVIHVVRFKFKSVF